MPGRKQRYLLLLGVLVLSPVVAYFFFTNRPVSGRVSICGALTLDLPRWSWHRIGRGIDTRVGEIKLGGSDHTLRYDIGRLAGNSATYEVLGPFVWQKHEDPRGIAMDYSLTRWGRMNTLIVSFPMQGPANFLAEVRNSNDIETVLRVMRTVRPFHPGPVLLSQMLVRSIPLSAGLIGVYFGYFIKPKSFGSCSAALRRVGRWCGPLLIVYSIIMMLNSIIS
jgi:hypothetical protein